MRRDRAQRHTRTGSHNDDEPADGEGQMAVGENTRSRQITPREYAAYRMCTRAGQTSLIHRAGQLMQQYIILAPSFPGGERYMRAQYQDST